MKVFDGLVRMGYKKPILLAGECLEKELAVGGWKIRRRGGQRKPRTVERRQHESLPNSQNFAA